MSERINLVLRLNNLARRIDALAEQLRKPGHDPEVSSELWHLCSAHARLLREVSHEASNVARGTLRIRPLPRNDDPIWKVDNKAPGVVAAIHQYLDYRDEEVTAVEVPERLRKNLERSKQKVIS